MDTNHRFPQTLPPQDECITEILQQWILTPFEDHITVSQDLLQDPQVNTVELSFNLHFPNVTQERINTPLVVHNDCALKEFIQGEERCLKFINQDLTFLQESHIPSTFTDVSHTTTSLKEPACINLPTHISNEHTSKENNLSSCTQSIHRDKGNLFLLVIPEKYKPIIFNTYHDSLLAGHQGPFQTVMTVRQKVFSHNLMNKVKRYIEACHICLKTKPKYTKNRPVYR